VDVSPEPEETSLELRGRTTPQSFKQYQVEVASGRVLTVAVIDGLVALRLRDPSGQVIESAQGTLSWQGTIRQGGTYQIDVLTREPTQFALRLNVD
jgi:hypothetical protein